MSGKSNGQVVEWITTEAACERLGKTARTLERLQILENIETKLEPIPGRKPRRLWYAPQIERIAGEREGKRRARIETLTRGPSAPSAALIQFPPELIQLLREILQGRQEPVTTTPELPIRQLWLTVEQAAALSGLSQRDIRGLAKSGDITARKSGRSLRIRRLSLEEYDGS